MSVARPTAADAAPAASDPAPADAPALRIKAGHPTSEELAALLVVLSALGGDGGEREPRRSPWSDPRWRLVGPSARRNGWRTSALPR